MKDIDFLGRTARVEFQIAAGGPDGSPFTTKTGAVYRHDHYGTTIFGKAVRAAGLPAGTTSHDLRHHYASVLLDAGEGPVAVSSASGTRTRRWC